MTKNKPDKIKDTDSSFGSDPDIDEEEGKVD